MPTDPQATLKRPYSSAEAPTAAKPKPIPPSTALRGTSQSSSRSSASMEARVPRIPRIGAIVSPGVERSSRNAVGLSPTRAKSRKTSAIWPNVIQRLQPLSTHPVPPEATVVSPLRPSPPTYAADVSTLRASLPTFGSVSANAPNASPVASRSSHCVFCAAVPHRQIEYASMLCTVSKLRIEEQPRPTSSCRMPTLVVSRPRPHAEAGKIAPRKPSAATRWMASRGMHSAWSQASANGTMCSSTNRR